MHFVATNGKGVDLDTATLPDGTHLRSQTREWVEDKFIKMKVPGVVRGQGRDSMIMLYLQSRPAAGPRVEVRNKI